MRDRSRTPPKPGLNVTSDTGMFHCFKISERVCFTICLFISPDLKTGPDSRALIDPEGKERTISVFIAPKIHRRIRPASLNLRTVSF